MGLNLCHRKRIHATTNPMATLIKKNHRYAGSAISRTATTLIATTAATGPLREILEEAGAMPNSGKQFYPGCCPSDPKTTAAGRVATSR
jgi:hypothetical protein